MLFSLFSVLFQNLEFIFKMLNRCSGKQGRGCSRFLAEWDNHLCHSCRDCSQDNPCDVCLDWSTLTWSKSIKAISKLSRWTNLDKTGDKVQTEGASRESSWPLQDGNEAPVVTDQTVSDVEVPSSLALTAGSNLGAPLPECSTAGNGTGNSSHSTCRRESVQVTSNLDLLNHRWDVRSFNTMIGSMAPVLVRGGPIVPWQEVLSGVQEPTALEAVVKAARLFVPIAAVITQLVLPRTVILDLALRVLTS